MDIEQIVKDIPKEKIYYQEKDIIIICSDCLEIMKEIPDESIDLVLTDPPYNISQKERKIDRSKIQNLKIRRLVSKRQDKVSELCYDFGKWDFYNSVDEQLEFAEKWLKESYRILKKNGQKFLR